MNNSPQRTLSVYNILNYATTLQVRYTVVSVGRTIYLVSILKEARPSALARSAATFCVLGRPIAHERLIQIVDTSLHNGIKSVTLLTMELCIPSRRLLEGLVQFIDCGKL